MDTFKDILNMQKSTTTQVDRKLLDVRLCLDNAFNKWVSFIPSNIITCKKQEYSIEKELYKIAEVLHCLFELIIDANINENTLNFYESLSTFEVNCIIDFKSSLWNYSDIQEVISSITTLIELRGFSEQEVVKAYCNKYIRR